jgi:shikimate dehydrogenase
MITTRTRICSLFGDPVEHSVSPAMHNAAFKERKLDFIYLPFRIRETELGKAADMARTLNMKGFNVTIPHKVKIIPYLDELDPLAKNIGAVNTVVNSDGILRGYNTDASGFLQALLAKGVKPKGKEVVVLGAGGASRAISFILAKEGAHLVILNRLVEFEWAVALASHISHHFSNEVKAFEMNKVNLKTVLGKADILINATSVGMNPERGATPVAADLLKVELTVFDIVYNPLKTRLLKEAEAAGARTISGLDMLVWQGAMAFEMWSGVTAPFELMKEEARKVLEGL